MTNAEMGDERSAEPAGAEQARPPNLSSWPHMHAEVQAVELAAIFQHAPAGLALYDPGPDLHCVRHNTRFLDLVGQHWRERGSIAGLPLRDLFDEASYLATRAVFERGLNTGEVIEIAEYAAVLAPDPEPRYYRWSLTPLAQGSRQHGICRSFCVRIFARSAKNPHTIPLQCGPGKARPALQSY